MQQLLCNRLAEDGLRPSVRPICVNEGDERDRWVSTTTFVLSLTIWEPASPQPHDAHDASRRPSLSAEALPAPVVNAPPALERGGSSESYISSLSRAFT